MTTEGYELDGIRTAMVETNEIVGDYAVGTIVTCGCGWSRGTYMENTVDTRAALRFHYQNCEQARGVQMRGGRVLFGTMPVLDGDMLAEWTQDTAFDTGEAKP